jgi:hypothetical protein
VPSPEAVALHTKAIRRHRDIMHPFKGQRILDADLDNHPVGGLDKMGFIVEAVRRIQIPLVLGFFRLSGQSPRS